MRAASRTWLSASATSSARAVSCASSRIWSAARASPPARPCDHASRRRRRSSPRALRAPRRRPPTMSSSESAWSSITVQRESSAEFTSKYGFSVVAPISVTRPSSTACSTESCCALLKRWISSMKRIVRRPLAPSRSRAPAMIAAHVVDAGGDRRDLLERGARALGDDARDRRLARAGRAEEDHRRRAVLLDREPQRRALAEHVLLADELVERRAAGCAPRAARSPPGAPSRLREKRSATPRSMLRRWPRTRILARSPRTTRSRCSRAKRRPTTSAT